MKLSGTPGMWLFSCDGCPAELTIPIKGIEDVELAKVGWLVERDRHLCPTCTQADQACTTDVDAVEAVA